MSDQGGLFLSLQPKKPTPLFRFGRSHRWSETGDRSIIKLFRDYVFHQVDENLDSGCEPHARSRTFGRAGRGFGRENGADGQI
jgi:hypothetical protein